MSLNLVVKVGSNKYYRIIQNIKWQDKMSNEILYINTKQELIVQIPKKTTYLSDSVSKDREEFNYQYAIYTPQLRRGKRKKVDQN